MPTARSVLAFHGVVLSVALVAACTSGHVKPGPLPTFVTPASTTTSSTIDFTTVDLGKVAGRPVVHVSVGPGQAALNGTVSGPDGAVAGATVHIERIVGGLVGSMDVASQPDGTWSLPAILGGLYRVRAFRSPDLSLALPTIVYLAATDSRSVDLKVDKVSGTVVTSALAPNPAILGELAELVVQVATRTVDGQGVERATPAPNTAVQLFGDGRWAIDGSPTGTTGAAGTVAWQLTCQQIGSQALSVVVNSADVFPLDLPACITMPTTTTSASTSTTLGPGVTTTVTTRRSTTTSTPGVR